MKKIILSLLFVFYLSLPAGVAYAESTICTVDPKVAYKELNEGSAVIIDIRNGSEYDEESIAGSVLIQQDKLINNSDFYSKEFAGKKFIVHCKTGKRGSDTVKALAIRNFNVCNLDGGIEKWKLQNLPTIKGGMSIIRQVQIVVGIVSLIFGLLSLIKSRKFAVINIIIGCGLIFAGVTGFCGLAKVLKMMPWN